jgi:hypothetical protein
MMPAERRKSLLYEKITEKKDMVILKKILARANNIC